MSGWSLAVSVVALLVSFTAMYYTRKQYGLAYEQDRRSQALKTPTLDILPTAIDGRHWSLEVRLTNRSDDRIAMVGLEIPSPSGGYVSMHQTHPGGPPVMAIDLNSKSKIEFVQRPIPSGDTGVWAGKYEISDAFPAYPGIALTMKASIKFLGDTERIEAISVTRQLN
jgi:hypothetical protein